ncbi:MAG: dentilisin complex subunit PrcA [Spirochaetales bacterium]|nr:dentilisin complex subunit PrcA [Spirochaetales bacterium]
MRLFLAAAVALLALSGCPQPTDPVDTTVPVSFLVVESINGTLVGGVTVQAFDAAGALAGTTTSAAGRATLRLEPDRTYTIVSTKTGQAQSRREGVYVDASAANEVTLVNQKLGMIEKPAVAPLSLGLFVSRLEDLSDMAPFDPSLPLDTSGTTYLIADLVAANGLEATAWSGFGAKLDFDRMPTTFNGIDGILLGTGGNADEDTMATHPVNSTFLFDLTGAEYSGGTHVLDLVAYDVANNRYEIAFPIELVANGAGADISAATVSDLFVDIRSYPVSRGFFGKDPGASIMALDPYLGTTDVSYRTQITFKVVDGADPAVNVGIRGFEVLRSDDFGVSYESIGTQSYGYLSTGASGVHTYFDADSRLEEGKTYFYRIKVFTDAANTLLSATAGSKVMPPVSASLVSPGNRSTVTVDAATMTGPDFTFSLSNTELWNAAESDYFYFQLTVNEKAGPYAVLGRFRYNFTTSKFQFQYGTTYYNFEDIFGDDPEDPAYDPDAWWNQNSGYVAYDAGSITVDGFVPYLAYTNYATGAAVNYMAGTAYEWDIIGDYAAGHPAWFEKAHAGGTSKSYVDGYSEGADTANGRFEFVAE